MIGQFLLSWLRVRLICLAQGWSSSHTVTLRAIAAYLVRLWSLQNKSKWPFRHPLGAGRRHTNASFRDSKLVYLMLYPILLFHSLWITGKKKKDTLHTWINSFIKHSFIKHFICTMLCKPITPVYINWWQITTQSYMGLPLLEPRLWQHMALSSGMKAIACFQAPGTNRWRAAALASCSQRLCWGEEEVTGILGKQMGRAEGGEQSGGGGSQW